MDKTQTAQAHQRQKQKPIVEDTSDRLEERNSRILLYGYSSDDEGSEVGRSTSSSPISPQQTTHSATTASSSNLSLTTPGIMLSPPLSSKKDEKQSNNNMSASVSVRKKPRPSPRPALQSSLSSPADFVYDRFSAELGPALKKPTPLDDSYDEAISPIEVATPVSYSRPSLISVYQIPVKSGPKASLVPSIPSTRRTSSLQSKSTRRLSSASHTSGYPAFEATPVEVPALPANALMMISNASRESLAINRPSEKDGKLSKKSSMPLLSRALKFGRARTGSKASSNNPVPELNLTEVTKLSSRPTTAVAKRSNSDPDRHPQFNAKDLAVPTRTMSASSEATQGSATMTALPPLPDFPLPPIHSSQPLQHSRRKSLSNLRSRSGSIGQALKSRISIRVDSTVPAVPIPTPMDPKISLDLGRFPAPPPPLPVGTTVPLPKNSVTSFSRPHRR